ncbi:MAG: hypothetical protein HOC21_03020 [Phycisphaerae bacterium]|nr:hypothetical protein [Phycisphaerae bacterium]
MIPSLLSIALIVSCRNADSPKESQITVEQRRTTINAAMDFLDAEKFTESLAIMEVLVDKDPSGSDTQESYGLVLLACAAKAERSGDVVQATTRRLRALEAYKTACKTASDPGLLYLSTAQLAHMVELTGEAKHYYILAHESIPNDARASFFISQIYLLDKNWSDAKFWIEQSLVRDMHEPYSLLTSALIEAELGNYEEANELAKRGCTIRPTDSNLRFIQARVLRITGEAEHALAILSTLPEPLRSSPIAIEEITNCQNDLEMRAQ